MVAIVNLLTNESWVELTLKATEFGEITLRLGLLRRSRSSKVTGFGTNRKIICDFLLVINTNLPLILHRFWDIAFDRSKKSLYLATPLVFNSPDGGVSRDDLRKILLGCQMMAKVPKGIETLPNITIASVGRTNVTDRDDKRTDDIWTWKQHRGWTSARK